MCLNNKWRPWPASSHHDIRSAKLNNYLQISKTDLMENYPFFLFNGSLSIKNKLKSIFGESNRSTNFKSRSWRTTSLDKFSKFMINGSIFKWFGATKCVALHKFLQNLALKNERKIKVKDQTCFPFVLQPMNSYFLHFSIA